MGSNPAAATSLRNFSNSAYPALPVSFGGDTRSRWSLLSGVYARGSKRSHQSALEMCNLSWTPPLLEKDNSKNNPVYNTQVVHSIGRKESKAEMAFLCISLTCEHARRRLN